MKKLFLIFTFLIYSFSVFTEAGLFIFTHSENETVGALLDIPSETFSAKALQDTNEVSHCSGENCHIGHCHHVSTLSNHDIYSQHLQQILIGKLNMLKYQNPYLDGLERPPKHI